MLRLITVRYTNRPLLLSELDWPLVSAAPGLPTPQRGIGAADANGRRLLGESVSPLSPGTASRDDTDSPSGPQSDVLAGGPLTETRAA
jgi:hypothetical protein